MQAAAKAHDACLGAEFQHPGLAAQGVPRGIENQMEMRDRQAGEQDFHGIARLECHHGVDNLARSAFTLRGGVFWPVSECLDEAQEHVMGDGFEDGLVGGYHEQKPA